MSAPVSETDAPRNSEYTSSRSAKFRFKSHKRRRSKDDDDDLERSSRRRMHDESSRRSRSPDSERHRHHQRRRHRRRHERSETKHEGAYLRERRDEEEETPEQKYRNTVFDALATEDYMSPQQAFRESLFDALADDEGAAYWEGVYGQPIHVFTREKPGPKGELEQMNDDEYASYVRSRMYEKTHEHIFEERERMEAERKRRRQREKEQGRFEADHDDFQAKLEASLRRTESKKYKARWQDAWSKYHEGWEKLQRASPSALDSERSAEKQISAAVPWPVYSGKRKHISKEAIEEFVRHAPGDTETLALLKRERVRWHPDKFQQRFGKDGIDDEAMKSVTEVFQILDQMWNELKG